MNNPITHHPYMGSDSPRLSAPIVLLNGWGMCADVWQSFIPWLQQWSDVVVMDVVYESDVDALCEKLHTTLNATFYKTGYREAAKPCVLIGWSLGGMLATRMAAHYPQSVSGLITLASNAQFVANDDWPDAMEATTFAAFYQSFQQNAEKTLQRFSALVVQGNVHRREQKRYLQTSSVQQDRISQQAASLLSGLDLLRDMNNQVALQKIRCPVLHCFGENDALVPVQTVEKIQSLHARHQCHVIAQAGHLLHFPSAQLERVVNHFLTEQCL